MEENKTRHLARILLVLVTITFVCNLVVLPLLPGIVGCGLLHIRPEYVVEGGDFFFEYSSGGSWLVFYSVLFWESYITVWQDGYSAVLTLFLFASGCCTPQCPPAQTMPSCLPSIPTKALSVCWTARFIPSIPA